MLAILLTGSLALETKASISTQIEPRQIELFDRDWKFNLGDVPGADQPDFSDASWRMLNLPHDWSIEGKVDSFFVVGFRAN